MEPKPLKDLILERLDTKGLNLEKIFQASGIPKHYLEVILKGDWHKLPAAPYAHGYFKKLESVLDFEQDFLWNKYHEEAEIRSSGASDKLPENRYAIKSAKGRLIVPFAILALFVAYAGINASKFLGKPSINVVSPLSATVVTSIPSFIFSGSIDPQDKLFINGEEAFIDKGGNFQEDYKLQTGLNTFELTVKRFLGKENKVVKQIIYQPEELH